MINNTSVAIAIMLTAVAGLCTLLGSLISMIIKKIEKSHLQFFMGMSAGVMIYVSFVELFSSAASKIGFMKANLAFFTGMAIVLALDFFLPHKYIEETTVPGVCDPKMLKTGLMTTLGIAIHNFPEGIAVFVGSMANIKLGLALALAIALHNIPEGIAVSMPIYCATQDRKKAIWYSFLAGAVEPLGAVVALLVLLPFLSPTVLYISFAFVAGIMVFISFDELLPMSYCGGRAHLSISGVIVGMLIMAVSLHLL